MYGTMSRMVKTTVYLQPHAKLRLARLSRESRVSEADLIRSAIDDLTASRRPCPRLGLFESRKPVNDWDKAMEGFGEA